MPKVTDSIRPELTRLLPSSLHGEVTCFVFYDHHPKDEKQIDIIIGTANGEIKEFFKRELVNNLYLGSTYQPSDIKIIRNGNCDLFYLVVAEDELTIVSRKKTLQIHRRLVNVERFVIEDGVCRGQAGLKVIIKDDAVPLVFDDNFISLGDKAFALDGLHADDSLPILTELMRKLTQTKYSVKCNERTLKEFLSLRQASALASYQKINPNTKESVFNVDSCKEDDILRMKSHIPWVKKCNEKIVIALTVSYTNNSIPIEDIHILLHGTNRPSMVYTTRMFTKTRSAPFWEEKKTQSLLNDNEVAVAAVVDLDEIAMNYLSKIEFNGVISYKRSGKKHVMPFDHVVLTSMDTMAEEFDALAGGNTDESMLSLAVVATTIKTKLLLRHIRLPDEPTLSIPDTFCKYLQMSRIEKSDKAVVYRHSPYNLINGVMLVFAEEIVTDDCYKICVFARSPSQAVSLIHYIYDAIPHKIIVTTPNINISPKSVKPPRQAVEQPKTPLKVDYSTYASSLLNQSNLLLEYLDKCMKKMGESKDADVRSKIGTEIDVMADGLQSFVEFRTEMLNEARNGVKSLKVGDGVDNTLDVSRAESDIMMTD